MTSRWNAPALASLAIGLGTLGCSAAPIEVAGLPAASLTDGLIAHWTFDEATGTTANDSSGNGRTGTVYGTGWTWVAGKFGSAMHFADGAFVSVPFFPQATDSYSVSAWVMVQANELGAPLADLADNETPTGGWALYVTGAGYGFGYFESPSEIFQTASCNDCFVAADWVHLTAVIDGDAASLTLYLNDAVAGVASNGGAMAAGSPTLDLAHPTGPGGPAFPLTGTLDDIAVYSRALVPEEVALLGQAPAPNPQ